MLIVSDHAHNFVVGVSDFRHKSTVAIMAKASSADMITQQAHLSAGKLCSREVFLCNATGGYVNLPTGRPGAEGPIISPMHADIEASMREVTILWRRPSRVICFMN